jgi:hypothetical protein
MLLAGECGHSAVKSFGYRSNTRRHGFGALTSQEKHHRRLDLCERGRHLQSQQSRGNLTDRPGCGANSLGGSKCGQTREKLTSVDKVHPSLLFGEFAGVDHLNSVAYLRAISRICSRVNFFGGTPGGLQVSRKKPSRPAGDISQSRSSS